MNKYRKIGIKLTPQRLAILAYLEGNIRHPSANDIDQAVLKKFPTISLATIYTVLAALKKKGNCLRLRSIRTKNAMILKQKPQPSAL